MKQKVILSLVLLLASGGCSENGNGQTDGPRPPDSAVRDGAAKDGEIPDGVELPDGVLVDQKPRPDQTVIPSVWKEEVASTSGKLYALWGQSATDVYAVGEAGLIMHRDTSGKWSAMSNAEKNDLYGIWGDGTTVYAAGSATDLYLAGTTWSKLSTSNSYNHKGLGGGTTYLFTAGYTSYSGTTGIHYRSKTSSYGYWSYSYSSTIKDAMNALWVVSDTEIYVVGDNGLIAKCSGSCSSYSGATWTVMTSGTTSNLQAIWGLSGGKMYAVGLDGTILHYDGSVWSTMNAGTSTYFYGVWASATNDVYVVGHPIFKADESIFHYDGTTWKKMSPPKTSYLNAVWGSGKEIFAAGKYNILHYTAP